ncbi:hypothetical protein [Streptomyces yaizuensis]|uniref:DUF461 domain-containing protein n=1 Tax=Streptomyces yaizuensis TaxID=2989713 RepID=A0ABQ5PBG9_9ACTN|nr:hypothetical protein [Streptomyces sp. YSPA8]GLF99942.1 DUF461 domain-containing protein [Streptomyces sp. YSPA8]
MSLPQTPTGGAPRLRRGALALTAVALSFTALTACGAGNNAQSLGVKPDNPAVTVDTLSVENANIITQPKPGQAGPAAVSVTIINKGTKAQTVESIAVQDAGPVKLTPAKGAGPVVVPAQGIVVIGGKGNGTAVIEDGAALTQDLGGVRKISFGFSETGEVKLDAFVVPAESYFKEYGPSSAPSPAPAAPKPAASASTGPSGEASGEPGAPASDEASQPATTG